MSSSLTTILVVLNWPLLDDHPIKTRLREGQPIPRQVQHSPIYTQRRWAEITHSNNKMAITKAVTSFGHNYMHFSFLQSRGNVHFFAYFVRLGWSNPVGTPLVNSNISTQSCLCRRWKSIQSVKGVENHTASGPRRARMRRVAMPMRWGQHKLNAVKTGNPWSWEQSSGGW